MKTELVCEAGFLWRFVMLRFEQRINAMLGQGWRIRDIQADGRLRLYCMAIMVKDDKSQTDLGNLSGTTTIKSLSGAPSIAEDQAEQVA